jgi:DNA mismatch endonuclease (patch repair protein)
MSDVFSKRKRSWIMARIKSRDTGPERIVRAWLRRLRFRAQEQPAHLPGKPDFALPRRRKALFVHGCFWHGHRRCRRATIPATRRAFWTRKIEGNRKRDRRVRAALRRLGWKSLVIWQCEITPAKEAALKNKILKFLRG